MTKSLTRLAPLALLDRPATPATGARPARSAAVPEDGVLLDQRPDDDRHAAAERHRRRRHVAAHAARLARHLLRPRHLYRHRRIVRGGARADVWRGAQDVPQDLQNLRQVDPATNDGAKYLASEIGAVGDQEAAYSTFFEHTRLALARRSITRAITDNLTSARFALDQDATGNRHAAGDRQRHAAISEALSQQASTDAPPGKWNITRTTVSASNTQTSRA